MRRVACLIIVLLLCASAAQAQRATDDGMRQPRILLLLDGSSSMLQPWNSSIRFKTAARIISALMDSIYAVNGGVEFGLRVYGHQSPAQNNDCFDSRMEVMFSKKNATQMALRLASLHPFGVSPIAYSLKEAAENDLADEIRNAYSVILITDGGESCGGNICDVVKTLIERKISFKPYILSLVNYGPLKEQYACLGTYLQISTDAEMGPAINRIVEAYRPMLTMPIMNARTESAAPVPAKTVVNIPAWIPDRSSVATLSITLPRAKGLPVYPTSRPVPRSVPVPRPATVPRPEPEPVRSGVALLAAIRSNTKPVMLRTFHANPVPRKLPVPRPAQVPRPEPEPIRSSEALLATIRGNTRPVLMPAYHANPVPRRRPVPRPAPVARPEPEPVRSSEALLAAIRGNTRPMMLRTYHANPVPRKLPVPRPAPVPRPEPEPVRSSEVLLAAIRGNTRPVLLRTYHANPVPRKLPVPRPAPVPRPEPEPVRSSEALLAAIRGNTRPVLLRTYHANPAPRKRPVPPPAVIARSVPEPVVTPAPVKRDTVAIVVPAATAPAKDTLKTTVVIKRMDIPVPPTVKPTPTPKQLPDNKPKETSFTSEREDAKETSLSILFTDGRGKFYASTPQLQLTDAATGKLVKQFYRTIDAAGNPDPQTVPPGTYNLLIAGRANMLMKRIVVEKDKNNKIIVKVSHGSLRFRYEDAPDRPVTEFDAIVNIRFEPGPTVKQRCTAELEYAPGNYYIEINTMPVSRFNTDIDFGAITEIQIPQPGYVQFTNKTPLGSISLYTPLGNKFVRFYGLKITGNVANQRLQLRPGVYEIHWTKNPSLPFASETIERFTVKSNSVTEVELH